MLLSQPDQIIANLSSRSGAFAAPSLGDSRVSARRYCYSS